MSKLKRARKFVGKRIRLFEGAPIATVSDVVFLDPMTGVQNCYGEQLKKPLVLAFKIVYDNGYIAFYAPGARMRIETV